MNASAIARPVPGTVPRTGLPEWKPYVYRGLGYDQLEPSRSAFGRRMAERSRRQRKSYRKRGTGGRCADCGYLVTAPGHQLACGGTP